jgi:hypothetical protein
MKRPVRRPGRLRGAIGPVVAVRIDLHRRTRPCRCRRTRCSVACRCRRFLASAREARRVEEGRRLPESDLPNLAEAVLAADVQGVLARFVREPGEPLAVGGPGGVAVGGAGRAGQVFGRLPSPRARSGSRRGLRRRSGAPLGERLGARSAWATLAKVGPHLGEVAGHRYRNGRRSAARGIEQEERSELLVDDGVPGRHSPT